MTRDEQEQTALMGGSAFQETGMMDDYLTRVAEAVRDAVLNETVDMASTRGFLIECIFDLPKIIASVPRPEPVAAWAAGTAAIEFALEDATGEGMAFLRCWLYGDFDVIRNEWPEAPESVYIGADPLHPETVAMLAAAPEAPPVAAQPAVPDGLLTAADMKHLRRFSECAEDMDAGGHDVPKEAMKRLERAGAVRSLGFGRHETTAFGDAMLAAAPEAPQTIQCNACDWIGSSADALYLGGREPIGPLCPECHETTGPADDAAKPEAPEPVLDRPASIGGTTFGVGIPVRTLVAAAQRRYEVEQTPASLADRQALIDALRRPVVDAEIATLSSAIRAMAAMLQAREWAEHVSTSADPDVTDLEVQITELVGTATKLREQNAALVAALMPFAFICKEGLVTKNYVTVTTCAEYFNRAEKVLAALASAKGGAA